MTMTEQARTPFQVLRSATGSPKAAHEVRTALAFEGYEIVPLIGRKTAVMIAKIIEDEMGGEVCTREWAEATAERIVSALRADT